MKLVSSCSKPPHFQAESSSCRSELMAESPRTGACNPIATQLLESHPLLSSLSESHSWMKRLRSNSTLSSESGSSSAVTPAKHHRWGGSEAPFTGSAWAPRCSLTSQLIPCSTYDVLDRIPLVLSSQISPLDMARLRAWTLNTGTVLAFICVLSGFLLLKVVSWFGGFLPIISATLLVAAISSAALATLGNAPRGAEVHPLDKMRRRDEVQRLLLMLIYWAASAIPATDLLAVHNRHQCLSEPQFWEADVACASHAFHLALYVVGIAILSIFPSSFFQQHVWRFGRIYLASIGIETFIASAFVYGYRGKLFPAPGGTTEHLSVSLLTCLISLQFAVSATPSARSALLEKWMCIPLSQCYLTTQRVRFAL